MYETNVTFIWSQFILGLLAAPEMLTTPGSYSGS